jgi:hypothetical protein
VKWSVATLVVLALLPNPSWRWQSDPRNPPLFTTSLYKSVFHKGETVLALPFSYYGDSMLLQAETQMHFRLAGGYLGPLWPTNYVLDSFVAPAVSPDPDHVLRFLEGRHVGAVVIDPAAAGPWPQVLTTLGMRGRLIGGALVYDVRGAHHA